MSAPVSALYAGLLAVLLLVLGGRVSLLRSKLNVGTGHGNDAPLARAIRVHGNAVEWILPMLVLLLLAEIDGAGRWFLHSCGAMFIAGRVAHAVAMTRTTKASSGRFWGTAASWVVIAVLAAWNIGAYLRMLLRFW